MRTTLDLPQNLIHEALRLTHLKTKTNVIVHALESVIRREKIKKLNDFKGRVKLKLDLNRMRDR